MKRLWSLTSLGIAIGLCAVLLLLGVTKDVSRHVLADDGPSMEKDAQVNVAGVQDTANLWLMKSCVDPTKGEGCLEIDEWIFGIADVCNPNDIGCTVPEGLGAWDHEIFWDKQFVSVSTAPDNAWLTSGGRVIPPGGCFVTIENESDLLEGCVTKDTDPPTGKVGPEGNGLVERITITPNVNNLLYIAHFRPTKDNGVQTVIADKDCEVTDTQSEPIPGTLPGQLTAVCSSAFITIRMLEGDLNLDCQVTVVDDQTEAFRYGATLGSGGENAYNVWYDLEPNTTSGDGDIDIKDLQFVFGRNYSTCVNPIPNDQAIPIGSLETLPTPAPTSTSAPTSTPLPPTFTATPQPPTATATPTATRTTPPTSTFTPEPTTVWLCRPGDPNNPCESDLTMTDQYADGTTTVESPTPATDPPIDCFYVYPTVSGQPGANANLNIDPVERAIAMQQASRFSQVCKVYAPMYRQMTLTEINLGASGADLSVPYSIAYSDVLAAWQDYLANYNHGRGVVFISHSQGTMMLSRLIATEIDPNPSLRSLVVSALLIGGNIRVPVGQDVGGDFQNIPACRSTSQTGCVVAYSSFNQTPPTTTFFGKVGVGPSNGLAVSGDVEVLCVNPASLAGGSGALQMQFGTAPFPGILGLWLPWIPSAPTPWLAYPGLYTGHCESSDGVNWLQVDSAPGDPRPVVSAAPDASWGLHLFDTTLAMGNLVDLVRQQSAAYGP